MPYIYKITNDVDDNIYIGKTLHLNPYDRFEEHLRDSKNERCKERQLYSLMNLYGQEHFSFVVIEEVENDTIACERECFWISFYDTYRKGLNGTLGGDGRAYLELNEKEVITYHMSDAEFVAGRTAKQFNVDLKTIKTILQKHNIKHLTLKEFRNLKSQKDVIEKANETRKKKVKRIDMSGNEQVFNSMKEAVVDIETKGAMKTRVTNVCISIKTKQPRYGYNWEYA